MNELSTEELESAYNISRAFNDGLQKHEDQFGTRASITVALCTLTELMSNLEPEARCMLARGFIKLLKALGAEKFEDAQDVNSAVEEVLREEK